MTHRNQISFIFEMMENRCPMMFQFRGGIRMIRNVAVFLVASSCVGCASIINDTTQPMKIETKSSSGELISGAECKLSNDYGSITVKSGETSQVRRSGKDLDIACKHPQHPDASARAISRSNAGMLWNILTGGGIGAIIDHNTGMAYTYPTWIQLVFGRTLVFDRSAEEDGMPVPGTEPTPGN